MNSDSRQTGVIGIGSSDVLDRIVAELGKDLAERHGYHAIVKKTSTKVWRMILEDWKRIIVEVLATELHAASKLKSASQVERPRILSAHQSDWRLPGGQKVSLLRRRRAYPRRKACNVPDQSPTNQA